MIKGITVLLTLFVFISFRTGAQDFKAGNLPAAADSVAHALLIPNAFTPNNDGKNDIFKIRNFSNQKLLEFKVFNRWGTILFHTQDPKDGWDGTFKNNPQPIGVYGYVIRIAYPDNIVETYKGTITLIR
ncbi:MAG TPA: gliding motility-associated C-terminal domain-containing protein [Edaphocola sp.]|nr:gliding motility-associated C-terminal domain-containing protein [Edaphocola sp.]